MVFDPSKPYNDLPLLPPRADLETRAVLKACIEARAALAELKQAGELIPNQAVLINSIPLLEAQASSEIENIVTTTDSSSNTPTTVQALPTRLPRRHCVIGQRFGKGSSPSRNCR